jgi:hypothetical protein
LNVRGRSLAAAQADAIKTGGRPCLVVRTLGTNSGVVYDIKETEPAPAPFDVAVGTTRAVSKSFVRLAGATAGAPLRNVMTFGYPESAQVKGEKVFLAASS